MHLCHEGDPGQMLTETVMQILPDSTLFPCADVQNRFLQMLSLGNVYACRDDVIGGVPNARQQRARPGDQPLVSMPRHPTTLIIVREKVGAHDFKDAPEAVCLFPEKKQVPDTSALSLLLRISGGEFACRIESQDASFAVEDN